MKATGRNFNEVVTRAAGSARIFFCCGPDESGAFAAADRIVGLLDRPGERVDLSGAQLRREPVQLVTETRSTSLFGDSRHIYVRAQGDEAAEAIRLLLDEMGAKSLNGWPVIVVASGATDKSRTAKLLEKRDDALVAMFHPPDLRSVTAQVRQMADAQGVRMGADLAQHIAAAVMLDTRMAASEVHKLALYLDAAPQSPRTATAADVDAIGAVTQDDGMMPLVDAVLSGNVAALPGELARFRQQDMSPVGTILALERRVAQLIELRGGLGRRTDLAAFVDQQPGIFFRHRAAIADQLRRWPAHRLARLTQRLMQLHQEILADSQGATLRFMAGCVQIARGARKP
ncbi:DNA polymerase III subunit delta [Croceicoccus sp. F390]|uniref:DNA-directed DNA polymerase n=1 Tax=Croceicoccus esteveae TaxID=3075597 RepID=A0ABU2ZGM2_9SPHN|nr:DNA polymerase III subunit delta [Croceicoccus sp. F390]MDT0575739.1 DNA polymerase III subunit delta [Croceicoccus sp. F390]